MWNWKESFSKRFSLFSCWLINYTEPKNCLSCFGVILSVSLSNTTRWRRNKALSCQQQFSTNTKESGNIIHCSGQPLLHITNMTKPSYHNFHRNLGVPCKTATMLVSKKSTTTKNKNSNFNYTISEAPPLKILILHHLFSPCSNGLKKCSSYL